MMVMLLVGCCMTMSAQLKYDLNGDGKVNLDDVAELAKVIMSQSENSDKTDPTPLNSNPPVNAVAVDLGLPSGTKWANMNVGAEKPEDYGLYFAWGEITGHNYDYSNGHCFSKENYKLYDGTNYTYDDEKTLELADDAAYMNWGRSWRMPTIEDINELYNNTTYEAIKLNDVKGYKFTSKINGNSIFLPNAGHLKCTERNSATWNGYYWLSSNSKVSSSKTNYLYLGAGGGGSAIISSYVLYRYYGLSVRPVFRCLTEATEMSKYDLNNDGVVNVVDIVELVNIINSGEGTGSGYFWLGNTLPTSRNFPTLNGKEVEGIVMAYTSLGEAMAKASRTYIAGEWAVVMYPSSWGTKNDLVFLDSANMKYYVVKQKVLSDFPDYLYYESTEKIGANTTITLSTESLAKAAGATLSSQLIK